MVRIPVSVCACCPIGPCSVERKWLELQTSKKLAMKIAEDPKVSLEILRSACLLLRDKLRALPSGPRHNLLEELLFDTATAKALLFDKLKPDTVVTDKKWTRSGNYRSSFKATQELKLFLEYVPMHGSSRDYYTPSAAMQSLARMLARTHARTHARAHTYMACTIAFTASCSPRRLSE
jgi:hypothetical protein